MRVGPQTTSRSAVYAELTSVLELEFHDADTDFLARIFADSPDTPTSQRKSSRRCRRRCRCREMRPDFLADIHARILARMSVSVSASRNASFTQTDEQTDTHLPRRLAVSAMRAGNRSEQRQLASGLSLAITPGGHLPVFSSCRRFRSTSSVFDRKLFVACCRSFVSFSASS